MYTYDAFLTGVNLGCEIEFTYKNEDYFITDFNNTTTLQNCTRHTEIRFGKGVGTDEDRALGRTQLLTAKLFHGRCFKEAFDDIKITWIS